MGSGVFLVSIPSWCLLLYKFDTDTFLSNVFQDENDSLRCQLEAYKNEVDLVRNDLKSDLMEKDKQVKVLQLQLQTLQKVRKARRSFSN